MRVAVTVEQIMKLETFSQVAKLVAGHGGIKNRITYVTIAEAPDFYQWVSGGEFVLSTLYAFKDHPELRATAYTELAKSGVAAIGIKTKRFFDEIPADIIAIANEYNLPVFEVKRETWFREIIQAITAELNNEQTNLLVEVERHYQELAEIALVSGDFDQFIQGLGRRRRCSIFFLGSDNRVLGSFQETICDDAVEAIKDAITTHQQQHGEILQYITIDGRHTFPCVMRGQAIGYLVLSEPTPLNEKYMLMAKQLTTFLTLKLIDQLDTEQKTLSALLDDILFKKNLNEEELRERLAWHGLKQKGLYRVVVVHEWQDRAEVSQSALFRNYCDKLRTVLDGALLIIKLNEAILIAVERQSEETNPPSWIKQLRTEALSHDFPLCIGIGPAVANASEIHSSHHMAKSTMKAGNAFGQRGVLYYSDFLARLLLLRTVDTAEEKYLLSMITIPLLAQDQRYNTQLLQTIGALIFADDLEEAAATLFVHINTVRYRLNKVKQLTGYDFFTAKGRYTITTAYLMHCYNR